MILETKLLKNEKHQTRVSLLLELVSDAYLTANRSEICIRFAVRYASLEGLEGTGRAQALVVDLGGHRLLLLTMGRRSEYALTTVKPSIYLRIDAYPLLSISSIVNQFAKWKYTVLVHLT